MLRSDFWLGPLQFLIRTGDLGFKISEIAVSIWVGAAVFVLLND